MSEMDHTAPTGRENPIEGNRTFSQDEVNRIVQERLAKEKQKNQEELTARESALAQKEFRLDAVSVLRDKGLPDNLADIIKADDLEAFGKNVDTILKLIDEKAKAEQEPKVIGRVDMIGAVHGTGLHGDPVREAFGLNK